VLIGPPRSGSSLTPPFSARLNVEAAGVVMLLLTAALFPAAPVSAAPAGG